MQNIFSVPEDVQKRLNIGCRSMSVEDEILEIFRQAAELDKNELSIDEVTAAYYNLFTLGRGRKEKNKKVITNRLFLMKGGTKDNGVLESLGKGVFRIRQNKK